MNLEALNAVTDEELRLKVARLRGATEFEWRPGGRFMKTLWQFVSQDSEGNLLTGGWSRCPNYLYEIAAAWQLVEKMVEMEWYPELINIGVHGELWCMYLDNVRGSIRDMYAQDENIKRAITLAFILAMDQS